MRDDGGPAFPRIDGLEQSDPGRTHVIVSGGLSARDYFAGQALAGLFAAAAHPQSVGIGSSDYKETAIQAYIMADAMLRERAQ